MQRGHEGKKERYMSFWRSFTLILHKLSSICPFYPKYSPYLQFPNTKIQKERTPTLYQYRCPLVANLLLMDTMHHVLMTWCIVLWVQFWCSGTMRTERTKAACEIYSRFSAFFSRSRISRRILTPFLCSPLLHCRCFSGSAQWFVQDPRANKFKIFAAT